MQVCSFNVLRLILSQHLCSASVLFTFNKMVYSPINEADWCLKRRVIRGRTACSHWFVPGINDVYCLRKPQYTDNYICCPISGEFSKENVFFSPIEWSNRLNCCVEHYFLTKLFSRRLLDGRHAALAFQWILSGKANCVLLFACACVCLTKAPCSQQETAVCENRGLAEQRSPSITDWTQHPKPPHTHTHTQPIIRA